MRQQSILLKGASFVLKFKKSSKKWASNNRKHSVALRGQGRNSSWNQQKCLQRKAPEAQANWAMILGTEIHSTKLNRYWSIKKITYKVFQKNIRLTTNKIINESFGRKVSYLTVNWLYCSSTSGKLECNYFLYYSH